MYVATVIDLYSRKIVGWAMDKTMTKELVISALEMAYKRQKPWKGVVLTQTEVFNTPPASIRNY
ncbi:hypothetical protein NCCP133_24450 [Cytobacillus sp. NCCP-133]|nr:hypothetical protein NCCP133_24450 [Cytobacillus sp. NCCP-133]